MRVRELLGILGAGLFVGTAGCVLPDIHDEAGGDPATPPSSSTGGTVTPQCVGATNVSLHFANVAPAPGAVDFCLGPHGNLAGPVAKLAAAAGGVDFSAFMDYGYKVDGPIDIRVIPAGGSCSGTSLGDVVGKCLTDPSGQASASVYYMAGQNAAGAVAVLRDEAQNNGSLKIRFFNTVEGAPGIDFGLTDGSVLPTKLSTAVASDIPFGHVPPPGNTILNVPVNDAGYMEITTMPAGITWQGWGAAVSGSPSASAVIPFSTVSSNLGVMLTIVAAGKVGDKIYPVQFLGFDETAAPVPPGTTKTPTKTTSTGSIN